MKDKLNLLAPAGSWEALHAAVKAGADSVYFGVGHLNMRARAARRFTADDLPRLANVCRENNVESCLAVNTLVYDQELDDVKTLLACAAENRVSAIIATDVAVLSLAREMNLSVHVSTQANISNIRAVQFYARYADAMVLARELDLQQIQAIHQQITEKNITGPNGKPVQIELFVHGALCISISGKCGMSLALTNHSANRGACMQTCRRSFRVIDEASGDELKIDNKYVMSPRDLCTIHMIDKLIAAGAAIFKIEGRGRSPEYVYKVTRTYRQAIDACLRNEFSPETAQQWLQELESVFNRGFWQGGYYLRHSTGEWSASYGSQATLEKVYVGYVLNYFQKSRIGFFQIEDHSIQIGDRIAVIGPTSGYVETRVTSIHHNEKATDRGNKGMQITFPVPEKIRRNDKLYLLRPRQQVQSCS